MGADVPKQFLLLDGVPILIHTINRFIDSYPDIQLILVLPKDHTKKWEEIHEQYLPQVEVQVAIGGDTRTASVRSGLSYVEGGLVAIHDAVRPFTSEKTIEDAFHSAQERGSGVAAVALKDSIRERSENGSSIARNRDRFVLVQTPQVFDTLKLKAAYQKLGDQSFTDDATLFEAAGHEVHLVSGTYDNIKITTPEDLNR